MILAYVNDMALTLSFSPGAVCAGGNHYTLVFDDHVEQITKDELLQMASDGKAPIEIAELVKGIKSDTEIATALGREKEETKKK